MKKYKIVGFSGRIKSGKSTLSKELSKHLNCPIASFGDYVRKIATERKKIHDREELQNIGAKLVENECEKFCNNVITFSGWSKNQSLIIDGIRHMKVLEHLKLLFRNYDFYLIYIDISEDVVLKRNACISRIDLKNIEIHQTESEVQNTIKKNADTILNGTKDINELVQEILNLINIKKRN